MLMCLSFFMRIYPLNLTVCSVTISRSFALLGLSCLLGTIGTPMAFANTPLKLDAVYQEWSVYSKYEDTEAKKNDKLCFVSARPTLKKPENVRHGDVYFFVARWKSGASFGQPVFQAGYDLDESASTKIRIDSAQFVMFTKDRASYIEINDDEKKLIAVMRNGLNMRVNAVSKRGTQTHYDFSLKGITKALKRAQILCK